VEPVCSESQIVHSPRNDSGFHLQVPTRKVGLLGLKSRPGASKPKRWLWKAFSSSARKDGATFCHWVRADSEFPDYPFARFTKKVDIVKYTDSEYSEHLSPAPERAGDQTDHDARWPREHTDLLFDLCRRYDLRWPVIYDRFDLKPAHSLEEMKLRFYTVTTRIINARMRDKTEAVRASVQPVMVYHSYSYKPEWEQKRRKQLDASFKRTNEALAQERELLKELRAIQNQIRKLQARSAKQSAPAKTPSASGDGMQVENDASVKPELSDQFEPGVIGIPASLSAYPPLFPNAASLSITNLAMKNHPPHIPGLSRQSAAEDVGPSGGMGAARRTLRPATAGAPGAVEKDPFRGVTLRSSQLAAPLEGFPADSKSGERVNAFLRELHVPDKPLAAAQVMPVYRQLKRESEHMIIVAKAVEEAEIEVHQLHALRRECGLKPLQTAKVVLSSLSQAQAGGARPNPASGAGARGGMPAPSQQQGAGQSQSRPAAPPLSNPTPLQQQVAQQQQQARPISLPQPQATLPLAPASSVAAAPAFSVPTPPAPQLPVGSGANPFAVFPSAAPRPASVMAPGMARPGMPAPLAIAGLQPVTVQSPGTPSAGVRMPQPLAGRPTLSAPVPTAAIGPSAVASIGNPVAMAGPPMPVPRGAPRGPVMPTPAAPFASPLPPVPMPAVPPAPSPAAGKKRKAGDADGGSAAKKSRGE
jgi:hypothetical protein